MVMALPEGVPALRLMMFSRGLVPAALVSVALSFACFFPLLSYGFTDQDTLLNIRAAKVASPAELLDQFGMKLTGGLAGETANFYRPVVNLAFVAMRAAFEWSPSGYHAVSLLLHALNGVLVAALAAVIARRLGSAAPRGFAVLAATVFLLHPVSVEVVPAIARQGDLWLTLFLLTSVLAYDRAWNVLDETGPASRCILPIALLASSVLLCVGSKEPGIVTFGVLPAYGWWIVRRGPRHWRQHALLLGPCALLIVGYLLVRSQVLGDGVGGYTTPLDGLWSRCLQVGPGILVDLTIPGFSFALHQWFLETDETVVSLALAGSLLFGLLLAWSWLSVRRKTDQATESTRVAGFVVTVSVCFATLYVATEIYHRRQLYAATAFFALLPAVITAGWWSCSKGRQRSASVQRSAQGGLLLLLAVGFLWQSPLVRRNDEWRDGGDATRLMTEDIRQEWAKLPPRGTVYLVNYPVNFSTDGTRRSGHQGLSTTNTSPYYALQAWLEDQFPDKNLQIVQLGFQVNSERLENTRHHARVEKGWLLFRVPETLTAKNYEPFSVRLGTGPHIRKADHQGFRVVQPHPSWCAVSFEPRPIPADRSVVVFDGERPFVTSLLALTGQGAPSDIVPTIRRLERSLRAADSAASPAEASE